MKTITVLGTALDGGQSWIALGICGLRAQQRRRVAPFRGLSLTPSTYLTTAGEMNWDQVHQAWASLTSPHVHMSPLLLKPRPERPSEVDVLIQGQRVGSVEVEDFQDQYHEVAWRVIAEAIESLEKSFDELICGGEGCPIDGLSHPTAATNWRVARYLHSPILFVANLDPGGAIAQVMGTLALLSPQERQLVGGIILNNAVGKGDRLKVMADWLRDKTQVEQVIPVPPIHLDMGVGDLCCWAIPKASMVRPQSTGMITLTILQLPHRFQWEDFDPLAAEATVQITVLNLEGSLNHPDGVILPGSSAVINDLIALHTSGMAQQLATYLQAGGTLFALGTGYHMLSQSVIDVSQPTERHRGLGCLPTTAFSTAIMGRPHQRNLISRLLQPGLPVVGYEFFQVEPVQFMEAAVPGSYLPLFGDPALGLMEPQLALGGSPIHGIFDNSPWRRAWLNHLRRRRGLGALPTGIPNYSEHRTACLRAIAKALEPHLDPSHWL